MRWNATGKLHAPASVHRSLAHFRACLRGRPWTRVRTSLAVAHSHRPTRNQPICSRQHRRDRRTTMPLPRSLAVHWLRSKQHGLNFSMHDGAVSQRRCRRHCEWQQRRACPGRSWSPRSARCGRCGRGRSCGRPPPAGALSSSEVRCRLLPKLGCRGRSWIRVRGRWPCLKPKKPDCSKLVANCNGPPRERMYMLWKMLCLWLPELESTWTRWHRHSAR
mmetsp:Transcript_5625/g.16277  ORF Transcript_5625/g.16277 Transcript_5625/m.16277 type:complete len:219 (-) Transcript_5625:1810-2466(-)